MAVTVALALAQERGGTPKISTRRQNNGTNGARRAPNLLATTGLAMCTSIDIRDGGPAAREGRQGELPAEVGSSLAEMVALGASSS